MLAIQAMVSLCVLALGVMMPAVANDLAIDPKLVGIFTAIIYAVAAVLALFAAGPIVRLGAVRVCQFALLMAAIGLAFNALALVAATVIAVAVHRRRARADQSRLGACAGPARAAPMVRHRLLAEADRRADRLRPGRHHLPFPAGPFRLARRQPGCRRRMALAAIADRRAVALAHRCRRHRRRAVDRHLALDPLRAGPRRSCACSAGRPSSMSSPSTPSPSTWSPISTSIAVSASPAPALLLSISQLAGTAVRLVSGGDRRPHPAHAGCWAGPASP